MTTGKRRGGQPATTPSSLVLSEAEGTATTPATSPQAMLGPYALSQHIPPLPMGRGPEPALSLPKGDEATRRIDQSKLGTPPKMHQPRHGHGNALRSGRKTIPRQAGEPVEIKPNNSPARARQSLM